MQIKSPYIFDNSPIEFILFGPFGGKDVVLIQSKSPSLDLFGLVNHRFEHLKNKSSGGIFSSLFTTKQRKLNVVSSQRAIDVAPNLDDRYSSYRFIWVGLAGPTDYRRFENEFSDSIPAIIIALMDHDDAALKVLIGGLVLECISFDEKRLRSKQNIRLILLLYLLFAVSTMIYWFWTHDQKS